MFVYKNAKKDMVKIEPNNYVVNAKISVYYVMTTILNVNNVNFIIIMIKYSKSNNYI